MTTLLEATRTVTSDGTVRTLFETLTDSEAVVATRTITSDGTVMTLYATGLLSTSSSMSSATITSGLNSLPAACYPIAHIVELVVQSIGLESAVLCATDGAFDNGLASLSSCYSVYNAPSVSLVAVPTLIQSAEAFCAASSIPSASVLSACCQFPVNLRLSVCPTWVESSTSQCTQYTQAAASTTTGTSPTATTTNPGGTSSAAAAAATTTSSGPNIGRIVGAAVGATLGVVLVLGIITFFFWHRRRKLKTRKGAAIRDEQNAQPQKAQLHSDDIKPDRKELAGPQIVQVRSVGTLEEMDGVDTMRSRARAAEMPSNEHVGYEMSSDGTTAVGSERSRTH